MQQPFPNSSVSGSLPGVGDPLHGRSAAGSRPSAHRPFGRARAEQRIDPFTEHRYQGFLLRGVAHNQGTKSFRPALEIRADGGEIVYERLFKDLCGDAQHAMEEALRYGRAIVDGFCQSRLTAN